MDLEQLKQILALAREHDLSEFELEQDGLKLKIRRGVSSVVVAAPAVAPTLPVVIPAPATIPSAASPAGPVDATPAEPAPETDLELAVVKSPIVGTFYRSTEPSAPPFVEVGSTVKKGDVLCIIEAMKLMNEIDSEYDGEVVNVYVENGQPVQYGERLFAIRTR
jgi:acetyl-CoA carboxylase biotin carboxyl carrier protein